MSEPGRPNTWRVSPAAPITLRNAASTRTRDEQHADRVHARLSDEATETTLVERGPQARALGLSSPQSRVLERERDGRAELPGIVDGSAAELMRAHVVEEKTALDLAARDQRYDDAAADPVVADDADAQVGLGCDVLDDHGLPGRRGAVRQGRLRVLELRAEGFGREAALEAHQPPPRLPHLDAGGLGAEGMAPGLEGAPDDRIDAERGVDQLIDGFL